MPLANVYFSDKEDEIIKRLAQKWNIPKHEVIKRIVMEFKENENP